MQLLIYHLISCTLHDDTMFVTTISAKYYLLGDKAVAAVAYSTRL